MKKKNGRQIGKRAEREAAERFNRLFATEFKRSQQYKGTAESADLIDAGLPEISIEVKRRADYSVKLHRAVEKAREETEGKSTAIVLHRMPGQRWLMTVDLLDGPEMCRVLSERIDYAQIEQNKAEAETEGIDGKRKIRREKC